MIKISSILNIIFSVLLLGVIIAMLFFGFRFVSTSDNPAVVSNGVESQKSHTNHNNTIETESKLKQVTLATNPENSSVIGPITEPVKKQAPAPKPKKQFVSLHTANSKEGSAFTSLEKGNGIIVYKAGPDWSEVISSKGVPVWVRGDLIKNFGNGYVEVILPRVNARTEPNTHSSKVVGRLLKGDVLKISRKQDGWVRVWSPIRFRAWAKTSDL